MLAEPNRPSRNQRDEIGLHELRGEALRFLIGGTFAAAYYLMAFATDALRFETWIAPFTLIGLVVASFYARHHRRHAATMLITGLVVLVAVEAYVTRRDLAICFLFAPVVGAAAIILGRRGSVVTATVATALVLFLPWRPDSTIGQNHYPLLIFMIWSNALLFWVAHRSLYTALDWSWNSFRAAQAKTEELQIRQGELNRILKSLNEAYDRLERLNGELVHARRAAEEAQQLKAEFAANVSHELRTPLNLVIGFSETMLMAPESYGNEPLPAAYRSDLDAIYRNARHLSSLIDDILDLSRVEAGRMGLIRERLDMRPIVEDAIQVISGLFVARGLYLTLDCPDTLPPVSVDRLRIRQVLINLLNNAARFTDRGGVTVSLRVEENAVVVSVKDTGRGIAVDDLPRVFEEFHQVGWPAPSRSGGTGLGLAICKHFVELHGGMIWAESEPGRGSTFSFSLPLVENVVTSPLSGEWQLWRREQHGARRQPTLVAVSEDPTVCRVIQRYLDGYEVLQAESIAAVSQRASEGPLDGVIVVTSSSNVSRQQLDELRETLPNVTVATCSLPGTSAIQRKLGVEGYLVKPVTRDELLTTLDGLGLEIRSVLIVDDDPEFVQMFSRMLKSSGRHPQVRFAFSGDEALSTLAGWTPDLVLLDLHMPGTNGYTVAESMKSDERLRAIPVVVVTAGGVHDELVRAGFIEITRPDGISVGELALHLKLAFA